ncbi:unnamed protein product [Mytilus coruscus]|uniref:Uncharacterized protein n=1 Tax=Mytilus coruscus TaxID=42192 RepID=A0A6J8EBZ2_MYTCO|nr:unnamed protein product [Mytilus coruscus]
MAKILIDGKINVNWREYSDSTPSITACRITTRIQENDDIVGFVKFLLDRGANIHLTYIYGKTAFDYAHGNALKRVIELFNEYNETTGSITYYFDFIAILENMQNGNQRCPIQMYLLYVQRRPVNMKSDEAKLYMGINSKVSSSEWLKTMDTGVHDTLVQQHSGHKSLSSINNYYKASIKQQREMSSVFTNFNKTNTIAEDGTITCIDDIPNDNEDQLLFQLS